MGWTVRGSNPGGARFSAPIQTGSGAHPAFCTIGTGSFPGVKSGRGVTLTPHPLLVPWSWKSRATTLLPLWAVRPVQSLSACTRVNFIFFFLQGYSVLSWVHFTTCVLSTYTICPTAHLSFRADTPTSAEYQTVTGSGSSFISNQATGSSNNKRCYRTWNPTDKRNWVVGRSVSCCSLDRTICSTATTDHYSSGSPPA